MLQLSTLLLLKKMKNRNTKSGFVIFCTYMHFKLKLNRLQIICFLIN